MIKVSNCPPSSALKLSRNLEEIRVKVEIASLLRNLRRNNLLLPTKIRNLLFLLPRKNRLSSKDSSYSKQRNSKTNPLVIEDEEINIANPKKAPAKKSPGS